MTKSDIKDTILTVLRNEQQQETNKFLLSFISHLIRTIDSYEDNHFLKKQRTSNIRVKNIFSLLEYS